MIKAKYIIPFINIFLSLFFCSLALAQQGRIDSLLSLVKSEKPDTIKVIHLNILSDEYLVSGSFGKTLHFCNAAIEVAQQLNFRKGTVDAYNTIGNVYQQQGDYPKALDNYLKALKLDEELNDKKGIAIRLGNIGLVYMYQGDYP